MSDTVNDIANRLLRQAANASIEETTEEQNFSSVVDATRRTFRRGSPSVQRGRKKKPHFTTAVFLMKLANADFAPGKVESAHLKTRGLGLASEKLIVLRSAPLSIIKREIIQLYPQNIQSLLTMCDFQMGKLNKTKQIEMLKDIVIGEDLERALKQSTLVILPLKDFPSNLPLVDTGSDTAATSVSAPSTSSGASRSTSSATPRNVNRPTSNLTSHIIELDDDSDFSDHHSLTNNSPSVARSSRTTRRPRSITISSTIQHVDISEDDEPEDDEIEVLDVNESFVIIPELPNGAENIKVSVSRHNCLYDLLQLYKDETIIDKNIKVEFLGEPGIDGGGLTKELFNIFFSKCTNEYFRGEESLVPHLELNKMGSIDNFIIIGRILQHMLVLTQTLPSKLSRVTLMLIGDPDRDLDKDVLIQDLLNYVNVYLRKILKKALKNYASLNSDEIELIGDFFTTNQFWARPNAESIKDQIIIIATEVLVEKPNKFITKLRQGVMPQNYSNFWRNCNFSVLIEMQTPTVTKIINCLRVDEDLTNAQNSTLSFFKMFLNCLDKDKLLELVFLVTGSFVMPDYIVVKFNESVGLSQRPTFSTCTNTITLPETYEEYTNLKHDLLICLNAEEAREYNTY